MRFAGIDLGSRSIKLVIVDSQGVKLQELQKDTGFDPIAEASAMIEAVAYDHIMATGYGRNLFELSFEAPTITEIKAHATGAWALFPQSRAVLDIGGQDSKAIALFANGKIKKFEMNDRCAAGTGKFLEIMAQSLGFTLASFGNEALDAEKSLNISSMCTVFAESEVTSLIARGAAPREIARGLHDSVVRRAGGMINRVAEDGDIVFTGGVANNPCIIALLEKHLSRPILIPDKPQFIGAYGAALLCRDLHLPT